MSEKKFDQMIRERRQLLARLTECARVKTRFCHKTNNIMMPTRFPCR